jgi:hypothetical protein
MTAPVADLGQIRGGAFDVSTGSISRGSCGHHVCCRHSAGCFSGAATFAEQAAAWHGYGKKTPRRAVAHLGRFCASETRPK